MRKMRGHNRPRFGADAGIAIGPILFIIAILGILAAAIAAGSGSFTAGTQNEGNSTKAAALVQIGENLKVGMDRLILDNGTDFNNVVVNPNNTSDANDLFAPSGGGIAIPSTSLGADPINDQWWYPSASVPQMGTSAPERLAMLQVTQGVCDQVNQKANAIDITATNYDAAAIGDPTNSSNDLGNLMATGMWPAKLNGRIVGCINDTSTNTYWFYQILVIQ